MWKRDQEELQKRCAEIKRILDAPTVNRGPNLVARDKVDRQISWIWKNMLAYCTCVSTVKVCNQWHFEMTDLNWRMRGNWTNIERNSLVSLLACFKKVLKQMLSTLPKGSVYVPAARQPVDHARAIELFVSCGNFFASGSFHAVLIPEMCAFGLCSTSGMRLASE